jgi:hypothetical protein
VSAKIDVEIFEKAWNVVIETNETLRTSFRWEKLNKPEAHLHGRTASPSSKYPTGTPDASRGERGIFLTASVAVLCLFEGGVYLGPVNLEALGELCYIWSS